MPLARFAVSLRAALAIVLIATAATWSLPVAAAADKDAHVVIISIDGFAGYLLDDPKVPAPTLRRLAKQGAIAVGGMKVSNPSVTWPNHTSLVTGVRPEKHGVLANGVLVRGAVDAPVVIDPKRDKADLVRVTTIFDAAYAAGLTTADINWPCTRNAGTLHDTFPDTPESITYSTPRLINKLVADGLLTEATEKAFAAVGIVGRDHVWTEAACEVIRARKPNLLLLHLLNCDSTHHTFGPQTPAGYTANAYADACVARVLAALDEAGIRDRTTVFIVADHGFATTPKSLKPNVVLRQAGLLSAVGGKTTEARVNVVPEGGVALVYCNDPGTAETDRARVRELFTGKEGIAAVVGPAQFGEYGLPHPREYAQAPDLVLAAIDGYNFSASPEGEEFVTSNVEAKTSIGTHGFPSTMEKMNALCIVAGRGIRSGVKLEGVENIDVAPTAARLLGLEAFPADGRSLEAALAP
ncbi:MAG: alkaline phosphatase family protein [Planctomycetaceae bacterium]|nr:alkaline phosphatase family protein [Planctomycetaceae bacterium]